jgi:phage FluMu protein Com
LKDSSAGSRHQSASRRSSLSSAETRADVADLDEPIDPSPTIDQAVNGGYSWVEIECSRCKTKRDVDLAALRHPPTTSVHDLAGRLRCSKCAKAGRRPSATLLQLAFRARHDSSEP